MTTKPIPLKPEDLRHVSGAGTPLKERPAGATPKEQKAGWGISPYFTSKHSS